MSSIEDLGGSMGSFESSADGDDEGTSWAVTLIGNPTPENKPLTLIEDNRDFQVFIKELKEIEEEEPGRIEHGKLLRHQFLTNTEDQTCGGRFPDNYVFSSGSSDSATIGSADEVLENRILKCDLPERLSIKSSIETDSRQQYPVWPEQLPKLMSRLSVVPKNYPQLRESIQSVLAGEVDSAYINARFERLGVNQQHEKQNNMISMLNVMIDHLNQKSPKKIDAFLDTIRPPPPKKSSVLSKTGRSSKNKQKK